MTSFVRPGRDARPARRVAAAGRHGLRGTLTDEARQLSADGCPIIDLGLGDPAAHGIPAGRPAAPNHVGWRLATLVGVTRAHLTYATIQGWR